jgi:hypothetical protein
MTKADGKQQCNNQPTTGAAKAGGGGGGNGNSDGSSDSNGNNDDDDNDGTIGLMAPSQRYSTIEEEEVCRL